MSNQDLVDLVHSVANWLNSPGENRQYQYNENIPAHLKFNLIWEFRGALGNGGIKGYFYAGYGCDWKQHMGAIQSMELSELLNDFERILLLFPGGAPSEDIDQRSEQLEELTRSHAKAFELFDSKFETHSTAMYAALSEFIAEHKAEFALS